MRELAWLAAGVFIGMVLGGACLLPTLVRLIEERDELRGAIEEWAEADAAIPDTAQHDKEIPFAVFRRQAAAERTLRRFAERPE